MPAAEYKAEPTGNFHISKYIFRVIDSKVNGKDKLYGNAAR